MALYKTITLELLQQRPTKGHGPMITLLDRYSAELKASHEAWMEILSEQKDSHPMQLSSEAMELAVKELETLLEIDFPTEESPFNLDDAMAFIKSQGPQA